MVVRPHDFEFCLGILVRNLVHKLVHELGRYIGLPYCYSNVPVLFATNIITQGSKKMKPLNLFLIFSDFGPDYSSSSFPHAPTSIFP